MTPWTVARQAPLSVEFPRQKYWSGLPIPSPGDLHNPGTGPMSPASPALASGFFTDRATRETQLANRWGSNLNQARLKSSVSNISLCCCLSSSRTPRLPTPTSPSGDKRSHLWNPCISHSLAVATLGCRRRQWLVTSQLRCLLSAKSDSPVKRAAEPLAADLQ